ncbi:unnamed protein product, partial [Prorocentrum cordatum]
MDMCEMQGIDREAPEGKISHHAHVICWSRHKERHFCWSCGATAEKHLSNKMVNSCEGWPAGQASRYALKSIRRKMDWAPGAGDRWSKNTMQKFTKSEQHKSNARDHARVHASSQNDERSVASGPRHQTDDHGGPVDCEKDGGDIRAPAVVPHPQAWLGDSWDNPGQAAASWIRDEFELRLFALGGPRAKGAAQLVKGSGDLANGLGVLWYHRPKAELARYPETHAKLPRILRWVLRRYPLEQPALGRRLALRSRRLLLGALQGFEAADHRVLDPARLEMLLLARALAVWALRARKTRCAAARRARRWQGAERG